MRFEPNAAHLSFQLVTSDIDFSAELERAIQDSCPKPKMVVLGFPSNPTAQCVEPDFFEKVIAPARQHDILIVHDLAYADIVFDVSLANSNSTGFGGSSAGLRTLRYAVMFTAIMEIFALIAHLLSTSVRVAGPGSVRAVIAESLLLKHQLIVLNRARNGAPRLTAWDRLLFGIGAFWVAPNRLSKIAIGIRPSTLLRFHRALIQRRYRLLFTPRTRQRSGPKGPSKELIAAILEMKRRNPRFGCPRIAQEMAHAFGVEIDKDVVRRILARRFRSRPGNEGPSWLSLIGNMKDSLWSVDLLRCESIVLKSYWVMVVMDLFTRRIVGIGVEPAHIDGVAVGRMFNQARSGQPLPKHLSTDHDPLFRFHP